MHATDILERLISFPSVVGTSNGEIVSWIAHYLEELGAEPVILEGPEGDRSNIFATFGPRDKAGYVLSGHMDVVPAQEPEWQSDPFVMKRDGGRFYGRGTTDMKGYLAAVLAAAKVFSKEKLERPLHIAFSYDEEAGCRGVPHMIARLPELCEKPFGAIIGEPSNMCPVLAHKGKAAARLTLHGRSGHSSRPDLGLNAIHAVAGLLNAAVEQTDGLMNGPFDPAFEPSYSSLQVGVISGGQAVNIIPDLCHVELEARAVSGVDPASLLAPIRMKAEAMREQGYEVEWDDMSAYPALRLERARPLVGLVEKISSNTALGAVSYGTEAGLYQAAGIDAIICGPGDIGRAHKPNEFILESELHSCQGMIEALARTCMN